MAECSRCRRAADDPEREIPDVRRRRYEQQGLLVEGQALTAAERDLAG
jgi:hypothetical protein